MESRGDEGAAEAAAGRGGVAAPARATAPVGTGLPAFGHKPHAGTVPAKLEPNGRVIIPALYREAFADGEVLVRVQSDSHLELYARRAWELVVDALIARAPDDAGLEPGLRRHVYMLAQPLPVDRQHRVVLPEGLRQAVGLQEDVVFKGSIEILELMTPERLSQFEARARVMDVLMESWDGLPTDRP